MCSLWIRKFVGVTKIPYELTYTIDGGRRASRAKLSIVATGLSRFPLHPHIYSYSPTHICLLRIGQKKPVHVYQLVAENTVESKVLDIQERKKTMIQQAFSGRSGRRRRRGCKVCANDLAV
jgi:hypothetical protein